MPKFIPRKLIGEEITFLSYNLYFKNPDKASSLAIIKDQNADILLFQEFTPEWENYLLNTTGKDYPYKITLPRRGTHGLGIYSKYPIELLENISNNSKLPIAQIVQLNIQNKSVGLVNAHLASPAVAVENPDRFLPLIQENYKKRKQEYRKINGALNQIEPISANLLIGDLNTTYYEPLYHYINTSWRSTTFLPRLNWQRNFPNSSKLKPVITLDYMFMRRKVKCKEFKVIKGGSSDHLAIYGRFKF